MIYALLLVFQKDPEIILGMSKSKLDLLFIISSLLLVLIGYLDTSWSQAVNKTKIQAPLIVSFSIKATFVVNSGPFQAVKHIKGGKSLILTQEDRVVLRGNKVLYSRALEKSLIRLSASISKSD